MFVIWPDQILFKIYKSFNRYTYLIQQSDENKFMPDTIAKALPPSLLSPEKNNFEKHNEDDYIDFYYERNLPEMLSREGPKAAIGDVNGDGLPDVYIGGTPGQAGQLYLQTNSEIL